MCLIPDLLGLSSRDPVGRCVGELVDRSVSQLDMARLEKGDFGGSKGGVQIEDLTAGGKVARWDKDFRSLMGSSLCISPDNKWVASTTHKLTGGKTLDLQIELRDLWKGTVVKVSPASTAKITS